MSLKYKDGPLETQCLIWDGALYRNGYGHMRVDGKDWSSHRYYYILYKGPIPEGFDIDHLCRVKACVNTEHLEAVTRRENNVRSGLIKRKTHCPKGHSYENSRRKINGSVLQCAECSRERYYKERYGI